MRQRITKAYREQLEHPGKLKCSSCKLWKPFDCFYPRKNRPGRSSRCIPCLSDYYKSRNAAPGVKERQRVARLRNLYDITPEEYTRLYNTQQGCCAICQSPVEYGKANVDHDHTTQAVRGLLCNPCNVAIGLFKENLHSIARAYEYLGGECNHFVGLPTDSKGLINNNDLRSRNGF